MCPFLCPRRAIYRLPPPYANQRGNEKPLVTIEDYKGFLVAVRFRKPLFYPNDLRGHGLNLAHLREDWKGSKAKRQKPTLMA